MKKLVLFALFACFAFAANAQFGTAVTLPIVAGDTIVNTGTVTKFVTNMTAGYQGAVIQMNLSKISGTGAGTVQLQVSLDNSNWVNSGSAFTITNVSAQSAYFTIASPVPVYCRLLCTGSGTESVATTTLYVLRRTQVVNAP